MTKEELIRMAREADPGFETDTFHAESLVGMEAIERFAALVAAAELRRLHALNAELVKTLKWLDNWLGEKPMPECVDRIRAALAEPEQEPFMVVAPECAERGCMAHDDRVDGSGIVVQLRKEQEEVRRLHAELERKSDAIQRLWKERDELRAVLTKIVGSK